MNEFFAWIRSDSANGPSPGRHRWLRRRPGLEPLEQRRVLASDLAVQAANDDDTTPPDLTIESFDFSRLIVNASPAISGFATDESGIDSLMYQVDESAFQEADLSEDGAFSFDADLTDDDGEHILRIQVADGVGNVGSYELTFTLDTVAPTAELVISDENLSAIASELTIQYSEEMEFNALFASNYRLVDSQDAPLDVPFQVQDIDGSSVRIALASPLQPGGYALILDHDITDLASNELGEDVRLDFQVPPPPSENPPTIRVNSIRPRNYASTNFTITGQVLSAPDGPAPQLKAVILDPDGMTSETDVALADDGTFRFTTEFATDGGGDGRYSIGFQAEAGGPTGVFAPFLVTLDTTAPVPVLADDELETSAEEIEILFDDPMTSAADDIDNYELIAGAESVAIESASLSADRKSVVIRFAAGLAEGDYQLRIAEEVANLAGASVPADARGLSFRIVGSPPPPEDEIVIDSLDQPEENVVHGRSVPVSGAATDEDGDLSDLEFEYRFGGGEFIAVDPSNVELDPDSGSFAFVAGFIPDEPFAGPVVIEIRARDDDAQSEVVTRDIEVDALPPTLEIEVIRADEIIVRYSEPVQANPDEENSDPFDSATYMVTNTETGEEVLCDAEAVDDRTVRLRLHDAGSGDYQLQVVEAPLDALGNALEDTGTYDFTIMGPPPPELTLSPEESTFGANDDGEEGTPVNADDEFPRVRDRILVVGSVIDDQPLPTDVNGEVVFDYKIFQENIDNSFESTPIDDVSLTVNPDDGSFQFLLPRLADIRLGNGERAFPDGGKILGLQAIDSDSNKSGFKQFKFILDTTAPDFAIDPIPDHVRHNADIPIEGTLVDNFSRPQDGRVTMEYSFDGQDFQLLDVEFSENNRFVGSIPLFTTDDEGDDETEFSASSFADDEEEDSAKEDFDSTEDIGNDSDGEDVIFDVTDEDDDFIGDDDNDSVGDDEGGEERDGPFVDFEGVAVITTKATDEAGNSSEQSFEAAIDTLAPTVDALDSPSGNPITETTDTITVVFSEPMAESTFSVDAFTVTVTDSEGNEQDLEIIDVVPTDDEAAAQITFADVLPNGEYDLVVNNLAEDLAGNPISSEGSEVTFVVQAESDEPLSTRLFPTDFARADGIGVPVRSFRIAFSAAPDLGDPSELASRLDLQLLNGTDPGYNLKTAQVDDEGKVFSVSRRNDGLFADGSYIIGFQGATGLDGEELLPIDFRFEVQANAAAVQAILESDEIFSGDPLVLNFLMGTGQEINEEANRPDRYVIRPALDRRAPIAIESVTVSQNRRQATLVPAEELESGVYTIGIERAVRSRGRGVADGAGRIGLRTQTFVVV